MTGWLEVGHLLTSKDANSDVGAGTTLLTERVGTQVSIFSVKKKLNKQKENTESPRPSRRKRDREARGGAAQMPITDAKPQVRVDPSRRLPNGTQDLSMSISRLCTLTGEERS